MLMEINTLGSLSKTKRKAKELRLLRTAISTRDNTWMTNLKVKVYSHKPAMVPSMMDPGSMV